MLPLLKGFFTILRIPRLWGYIWKPMGWAVLIYALLFGIGAWLWVPRFGNLVPAGWPRVFADFLGTFALAIFWLFFANFIFLALGGLFSSFLWDSLSERAETEVYGNAPKQKVGCVALAADTLLRILFAALLLGISWAFSWLGIVVAILSAGVLSLLDFSAAAYLRRGVLFPAQLRALKTKPAIGFIVISGLLALLPFVFLLAMPAMVVGGTILCKETEDK